VLPLTILWQDLAIALGSAIGVVTKAYALWDTETVWSRRASVTNALFYPPSLVAFATLGLWLTFVTTLLNFSIWVGVALWRAPPEEDWLGRRQ